MAGEDKDKYFERLREELSTKAGEIRGQADREIELKKKDQELGRVGRFLGGSDLNVKIAALGALLLLLILAAIIFILMLRDIPEKNVELVKIALGGVMSLLTGIFGFICGHASSKLTSFSERQTRSRARNQSSSR